VEAGLQPREFMIDIGTGPPLVLVPGLQGRWEWMRPAVDALADRFRVLTFSLAGEKDSDIALPRDGGFDTYVQQIDAVLDRAGASSAIICGISFGALIAFRYATLRGHRVRQLILASPVPPDFELRGRFRLYSRLPRLFFPLFCVDSARRVMPEWLAVFPRWTERLQQAIHVGKRVIIAPASPALMGRRIESMRGVNFRDAESVAAPTLILIGESGLDRTVPPEVSCRYCALIPHAEIRTMDRTGHLGTVTRPDAFASEVSDFVERAGARHASEAGRKLAM
jgi:pimeloyl-ACP methyl ester carboxylesterase